MATAERPVSGRILALDVGRRRIGLAVSDPLLLTAQGLPTLERKNNRADLSALAKLAAHWGVTLWLVGYPVELSGREGSQAEWVRRFAQQLSAHTGLPVKLWDERLTTAQAGRLLRESGASIARRARAVDRLAAALLLQNYLDCLAHSRQHPETLT